METNKKNFVVVGLGEVLWDMLPSGRQLGGAPANFAYHAHCLGARGYVVSCVGKDNIGFEILENLDKLGLNREFVSTNNYPTGTVTVELDTNGTPNYIIHENVAWDYIPLTTKLLEFAPTIDAVCFGSLCQRSPVSAKTIRKFLKSTKEGCIRIFDVNIRQNYYSKKIIELMLESANVFKLNDEELSLITEMLDITGDENQILKELIRRYGLKLIILTKGRKGSILFGDGHLSQLNVAEIQVVDTVGAGDAFSAAVAMGLLHKKPIDEIHRFANCLAGFVCSKAGATPPLDPILKTIYENG